MEWVLIGLIIIGATALTTNVLVLMHIWKAYAQMKIDNMLLASAVKEGADLSNGVKEYVEKGLTEAEKQYRVVMEQADTVLVDYQKVMNKNHELTERMNKLEEQRRKPMDPDVQFN